MSLTPFDRRLLAEGLAYFERPRLATLLESLGVSKLERVDTLAAMLRYCSPDEFDEMADIIDRALGRTSRHRARRGDEDTGQRSSDAGRRRYSASAERRAQRRRSA